MRGPWPLLWGSVYLVFFSFLMLQAAGHPWSVTFAFGLWGAKIASAIGIDVASWFYWQLEYPSTALENSVLADPTTVSNIGIILGALAGFFGDTKLKMPRIKYWLTLFGGLLWVTGQD